MFGEVRSWWEGGMWLVLAGPVIPSLDSWTIMLVIVWLRERKRIVFVMRLSFYFAKELCVRLFVYDELNTKCQIYFIFSRIFIVCWYIAFASRSLSAGNKMWKFLLHFFLLNTWRCDLDQVYSFQSIRWEWWLYSTCLSRIVIIFYECQRSVLKMITAMF